MTGVLRIPPQIQWLLRAARPYTGAYAAALALVLSGNLVGLVNPLIFRWLIDTVLNGHHVGALAIAVVAHLVTFGGGTMLTPVAEFVGTHATERLRLDMRERLLDRLHRLAAEYHENTPVGDSMFCLQHDVDQVSGLCSTLLVVLVRALTLSGLSLGIMMWLDYRLTLIVLPMIPAYLFLRRRYDAHVRRWSATMRDSREHMSRFLEEDLSAVTQLQLLRCETAQLVRFCELGRAAISTASSLQKWEMGFYLSAFMIVVVAWSTLLFFGGLKVMNGTLTVGTLVAVYSYVTRLFEPLARIISVDSQIATAAASLDRLMDLSARRSVMPVRTPAVVLSHTGATTLELSDVRFGYGDGPDVIQEASLTIGKGEHVSLVGASGSGKSTISKLAVRLYDVRRGAVRIGGHDVRDIDLDSLRSNIALIPQQPFLFDGSLRDNLLLGNPHASMRDLERAASTAQLDAVISALRRGWDEPLGPKAIRLSGGERQRVALARALVQQPAILILDEATSALDAATEEHFLEALRRTANGVTILFISHRPSVVMWADRVVTMKNGHLTESATWPIATPA